MARTTAAAVKEIFETDLSEVQVLPFVTSANVFVNELLGTGTSNILTEIEKWVACHMLAISRERQAKSEEASKAKVTYTGEYGVNLNSTSYGQMAISLDTSGVLANAGMRVVSIYAVTSFD